MGIKNKMLLTALAVVVFCMGCSFSKEPPKSNGANVTKSSATVEEPFRKEGAESNDQTKSNEADAQKASALSEYQKDKMEFEKAHAETKQRIAQLNREFDEGKQKAEQEKWINKIMAWIGTIVH